MSPGCRCENHPVCESANHLSRDLPVTSLTCHAVNMLTARSISPSRPSIRTLHEPILPRPSALQCACSIHVAHCSIRLSAHQPSGGVASLLPLGASTQVELTLRSTMNSIALSRPAASLRSTAFRLSKDISAKTGSHNGALHQWEVQRSVSFLKPMDRGVGLIDYDNDRLARYLSRQRLNLRCSCRQSSCAEAALFHNQSMMARLPMSPKKQASPMNAGVSGVSARLRLR